jgi:hypothetical protein
LRFSDSEDPQNQLLQASSEPVIVKESELETFPLTNDQIGTAQGSILETSECISPEKISMKERVLVKKTPMEYKFVLAPKQPPKRAVS